MTDTTDAGSGIPRVAGVLCALLGAFLVLLPVAALVAPGLRVADPKLLWAISALGVALAGCGLPASVGCHSFGLVVASLFLGGAGQLWLTDPLWFPTMRIPPEALPDLVAYLLIAVQAAVATAVLLRSDALRKLGPFIKAFGIGTIVLFLVLSVIVSISPMGFAVGGGHWKSYAMRLVFNAGMLGINLLTLAALFAVPAPKDRFSLPVAPFAAFVVLLVSASLSHFALERLPHVQDEVVYLFQARTYTAGVLAAPAPAAVLQPGLEYYLMDVRDGRWIGTPMPGWPAILTVGVLIRAPWLVNPVLAALSVLLAHALVRRIWGKDVANIVVLLMAVSPWYLGTAASLMPHNASLFLVLSCWLLLVKTVQDGRGILSLALVAGLCMGWVFVIRQLEAVILGIMTGLWLLTLIRQPLGIRRIVAYSFGCIASGLAYFAYNYALTGNPLEPPLARYINELWGSGANAYGFGPDIGPEGGWGTLDLAPGHYPFEGLMNTGQNFAAVDMEFLGWGVGSLALVWCMLLLRRLQRADLAMIAVIAVIVAALFLYWFSGSFYIGPRYWFMTLVPFAILSGIGFHALSDRLQNLGLANHAPVAVLVVLCAFSLFVFVPWRGVVKYHEYRGYTSTVRDAGYFSNELVFVTVPDLGAALVLNDPFLPDDAPIFLKDLGKAANNAVIAAYPDRPVHYITEEAD